MGHDPAELGHEAVVAPPARQELGKRLDRHQRILDLVRDPGRQHLEVGKPLGPLSFHFERLQRGEVAEDGDGAQHGAGLIVQRRRRADDRAGRRAVGHLDFGLGSGLAARDGLAQHGAHARRQRAQRLKPHPLDGESGELLRGPVDQGDLASRVDGHHPTLDREDDVVEVLIGQEHLRIELSILHRDAGLIGERHQQIEILGIERIAGKLGPHDDGPDDGSFRDEREDEGPVETHELVVEAFAVGGQAFTPDLIGE